MKRIKKMLNGLGLGALAFIVLIVSSEPTEAVSIFGSAPATEAFPTGRILVIDFPSGTVVATLPGPAGVVIGDGFTGLTFADTRGTFYVVDGFGTNIIFELDPTTGAVVNSFPSPTGSDTLDGLAFLNNTLFGLVFGSGGITQIDPDTGADLGTLTSVGGLAQGGLDGAAGRLFSRGASNTTIVEIDPVNGSILNSFSSPDNEAILGLAFDGVSLYASSSTGKVFQLDANTGTLIDTLDFETVLDGLAVMPMPDLGLTKTDSPDPVTVGENLTYTVVVTNNGPAAATGVTLTDTLPGSVTFVSATPTQGTCSESGGEVICILGDLSNGTSATVTIVVMPTTAGEISNTASVTGNQPDPNTANNTATEATTVIPDIRGTYAG
ncbi:MAG: DUF7507 domain-containing protein [Candidatus Binatia bacterium]